MSLQLPGWPASWSRLARSNATLVAASAALVLVLWGMARVLALAPDPIGPNAQDFADGTWVTVQLTLVAGVAGLALGLLAALGKLSRLAPLRWLAGLYIWVMRGTPLLVQVLFVYFALPSLVPALKLSDFASACIALALNVGAYNAEAIRAGLQAVPKGQVEASRSLGLTNWWSFVDIVFPQAIKISLPSLVNNIVSLLKYSSLAYTIGVVELTNVGNRIQAATFQPMPTLVTTALVYLVLTTVLTQLADAVEQRYDVEGRRP